MMSALPKKINTHLKEIERIVNNDDPVPAPAQIRTGIDLGTADIVLIVIDENGRPLAAFLEWAEVVRDGVVLDYWGAVEIVKELVRRAEQKLGKKIESAVTSYPPGTDARTSENVLIAAGLRVDAIVDEPSSVAHLLEMEEGAVVDIGGGTTGISVVREKEIVYTADEATGGRHITLTLAGNRKISYKQAESLKRNGPADEIRAVIHPVFQKMSDIIRTHIKDKKVKRLYFSGGTCCFPGVHGIFSEELEGLEIIMPHNPLYLTPLAIASYKRQIQ